MSAQSWQLDAQRICDFLVSAPVAKQLYYIDFARAQFV